MTFLDLVAGDHVFLDANTLVYHFGPHPTFGAACNGLLYRIENQEPVAFTSTYVHVIRISPVLIAAAAAVSQRNGLLCSDALIVSIMEASGLTKLASADTDFDRVPGLTPYAPT